MEKGYKVEQYLTIWMILTELCRKLDKVILNEVKKDIYCDLGVLSLYGDVVVF